VLRMNVLRRNWAAVLACGMALSTQQASAQPMSGQQSSGQTPPGQTIDPRQSGGSNAGMPRGTSGGDASGGTPGGGTRGDRSGATGPISGRVVLSDGADPQGVAVERFCGQIVNAKAYTDSNGRFTIQRMAASSATTDVSVSATKDSAPWSCELRASFAGYTADALPLGNRRVTDAGDAGVIMLRRVGAKVALTVSATTLLAPKEARRSYDKGLEAIRGHQPDKAQKDFANAVKLYPRFAASWYELGKVYEQRSHLGEARNAYGKAIAADAEYLYPYERLYRLDVRESKWQEAADTSAKVLRLNPYEFSAAYYFNAVSNLNLAKLDAAEHSARESAKLQGAQAEPRGNYVLGVILWRKGDLDGAAETMQAFLANPPAGPEWASARRMLDDIERQIARRQARAGN
jgi:tetratricopeptide (TPR) repeat protein